MRIIPAYAGSTDSAMVSLQSNRDHPRIRGEHDIGLLALDLVSGSSPHTRGAQLIVVGHDETQRIIPAYAGSTDRARARRYHRPDHPRIRGEHYLRRHKGEKAAGSSPHTRGALGELRVAHADVGIIPAYAGSTASWPETATRSPDHPRIRGEHYACTVVTELGEGSSPHTRGARPRKGTGQGPAGIIPAYAGSTRRPPT